MSELKSYDLVDIQDYRGEVYLKSEADKVIADLIEKNKRLAHKDAIMASETIKDLFKELYHHKYKRCLAMAEMCNARYDEENATENWRGLSWHYTSKEMKYWEHWHKRWLELAAIFKEAK